MAAETRTFWKSPSGRLHLKLGCTGAGPRSGQAKVRLTREEFAAAQQCRCVRYSWPAEEPLRPLVWFQQVTPDVAVGLDDSLTPVLVTTEGKGPRWTISNVAALRDALDTMHAEAVNRRG